MTKTPGPSITSRPRTNDTHWLTLLAYVVLGVGTTIYAIWTVLSLGSSPYSFRSGLILSAVAILSFFAYLALFRDAIHLSHAEIEWTPNWLWYFAPGLGIPAAVRFVLPSIPVFETSSPLLIVYSLVFTTTAVCLVYLYRRWRYVPDLLEYEPDAAGN
ncbi:hypothetical protein [Haloarcula marina]|uniref:hypothetical protein n=1 Tax=Haloarcula marina TaxID=2961574 RepID=UPI0020B782C9|nr:hypothetical protein [Halomicroarcula marina]